MDRLYMIFKGRVGLSLKEKKNNEYFILYPSNYFGDYQILLELRATESFTVFGQEPVFTHCLEAEEFKDLMRLFPDALNCFLAKAIDRRAEFRRIKKIFQLYSGTIDTELMDRISHKGTFDKLKFSRDLDHKKFTEDKLPEFLDDQDYYFKNFDPCIDMEAIYGESESEKIVPLPTEQDFDDKLTEFTDKKL